MIIKKFTTDNAKGTRLETIIGFEPFLNPVSKHIIPKKKNKSIIKYAGKNNNENGRHNRKQEI